MTLRLTAADESLLHGEQGEAAAFAMRILTAFADAVGAPSLLDISRAHIDGCLYHGAGQPRLRRAARRRRRTRARADDAERRRDRPDPPRTDPAVGRREQAPGRRLMVAHEELGCVPSFTCAPYQTAFRPALRRAGRVGRIERDRVRQLGHRRAHEPLWRFHRPVLRDHRPRAGVGAAPRRAAARPRPVHGSRGFPPSLPSRPTRCTSPSG